MSAVMHPLRRPGRRIAELDPFAVEAGVEPSVNYGCVDWYVYQAPRADTPAPQAQPKVAATGRLLIPPPGSMSATRH